MSGFEIPLLLGLAGTGIGAAAGGGEGALIGGLGGLGAGGLGAMLGLPSAIGLGATLAPKEALTGLNILGTGLGTGAQLLKAQEPPPMRSLSVPSVSPSVPRFQGPQAMSLPDLISRIAGQGGVSPAPTI